MLWSNFRLRNMNRNHHSSGVTEDLRHAAERAECEVDLEESDVCCRRWVSKKFVEFWYSKPLKTHVKPGKNHVRGM